MGRRKILIGICGLTLLVLGGLVLSGPAPEADTGSTGAETEAVALVTACVPEEQPALTPGPLGSPLRISSAGADGFLVADYRDRAIYLYDPHSGQSTLLFAVEGKPLSVARTASRDALYWIGNGEQNTLDLYQYRGGKGKLKKRLFRKPGIQALDIELVTSLDRVYVVDGLSGEVKVLDSAGSQVGHFGGTTQAPQFIAPKALAIDETNGVIAVSYYGDPLQPGMKPLVGIFDLSGNLLLSFDGNFARPQGVAFSNDRLFLADALRGEIQEFNRSNGSWIATYGCFGASEGHLLLPMDVTLDGSAQALYVADNRNGRITVLPLTP